MRSFTALFAVVAAAAACLVVSNVNADCSASDAKLTSLNNQLCASLVGPNTPWCNYTAPVSVSHDWPSQATYLTDVLNGLTAPGTCLNTSTARNTLASLDTAQANPKVSGSFMNTWQVFQVQYYDMPRKPGDRIESPDTLGRKCWAFAWLKQMWEPQPLIKAASVAGVPIDGFVQEYEKSVPETMNLCEEVMANCFKNTTYTPSRNGTCPSDIFLFHYIGFERENLKRGFPIKYPFH
eukprot:TRINITY_DN92290_c0_g1_i1.p1 TRINITY_DN92290_c0_g1~~TRINITY_DN92290_c0_g1_i1.p1  ORF type:complete len:237 (+),score=4.86 TRINITY_DN92290_c0_g1_i1:60-770(+)